MSQIFQVGNIMDQKLSHVVKEKLLLKELSKKGAATANEVIDTIFNREVRVGAAFVIGRGWRFYVHLNKHFSVLKKNGYIVDKGKRLGPTGRMEKVWVLTHKSLTKYFPKAQNRKDIKLRVKMSLSKLKRSAKKAKR